MADLQGYTLPAPVGGYDTETAVEDMPLERAPLVHNFLLGSLGALVVRGPITNQITVNGASSRKPVGVWTFQDKMLIGYRDAPATVQTRDTWVAPYRKAPTEATLAVGILTAVHVDLLTGTVTNVAITNQGGVPGPAHTRIAGKVYGISFAGISNTNEQGGWLALTSIARWDGTTAQPTVYTNAPRGAQDIAAHFQRIFVLGGRNPDNTGLVRQNTLWFTDPLTNADLPDTLVAWQDNTSGLTNQIEIDADDPSDHGVALAKVGDALAIFKRHSLYLLKGYGTDTFSLRPYSTKIGCIDPRSVVEFGEGVFFMSEFGFMWFDGTDIVPVADHVRSDQLFKALAAVGDTGVDGGYCTANIMGDSYIMVNIGEADSATALGTPAVPTYSAYMHIPTRAWATFNSALLEGTKPLLGGRSQTREFLMDAHTVYLTDNLTTPELEEDTLRGKDSLATPWLWTATPSFTGTGGTLENDSGVDMFAITGPSEPIVAEVRWKIVGAGFPFLKMQLSRVLVDYNYQVAQELNDGAHDGWLIELYDANGQPVATPFSVPSQAAPASTAFPFRRRYQHETHYEADEVEIRARIVDSGQTYGLAKADIQRLHVEIQKTRRRPSD